MTILPIWLSSLAFVTLYHCSMAQTQCPNEDPSGWPYAAFSIETTGTKISVSYEPDPYPKGLIVACYKVAQNVPQNVTISYHTRTNHQLAKFSTTDFVQDIRLCQENRFPFPPFSLGPGDLCRGYMPWCSSELNIDFKINFELPGYESASVFVCCYTPNDCHWD